MFDRWNVCGHRQAVSRLSGELRANTIRHAYLFSGPAGLGKMALAQSFCKAIVCMSGRATGHACGECDECRRAEKLIHPDVTVFSLQTQSEQSTKGSGERISIDTVRELSAVAAYRPYSALNRVIILDDAETLTEIAQEALLKTLEDPPPHVVIVLIATRSEPLRPTIRSRCEAIELGLVDSATIADCLKARGMADPEASHLASLAEGRPGWALAARDDESIVTERKAALARALEWIEMSPFQRVCRAFELASEFSRGRSNVFAELETVELVWRRVMMRASGALLGDGVSKPPDLTLVESVNAVESVSRCMSDLDFNVRPRLALQSMVMEWPEVSRISING